MNTSELRSMDEQQEFQNWIDGLAQILEQPVSADQALAISDSIKRLTPRVREDILTVAKSLRDEYRDADPS